MRCWASCFFVSNRIFALLLNNGGSGMDFNLQYSDKATKARAGKLTTDHGEILTPIFMPVGTVGSVKGIQVSDLENAIRAQIILGNTYHLYLRPGLEVLRQAGGLQIGRASCRERV